MTSDVFPTYNDGLNADAARVLDILGRWDQKMQGHHSQKRTHDRVNYPVRIRVYSKSSNNRSVDKKPVVTAWARNLSPQGLGFIYKGKLDANRVVVCLDPDSGETTWFQAAIIRCRQVHNDFWEYGARFIGRSHRNDPLVVECSAAEQAQRMH